MKWESVNLEQMNKTKFLSIRNGGIETIQESDEDKESTNMQFTEQAKDEEIKNWHE